MRQPSPLAADPQVPIPAVKRVDDVAIQSVAGNLSTLHIFRPPKPSGNRAEPNASVRIYKHGIASIGRQTFGSRIGHEGAITEALNSSCVADPKVSLPIFK